MKRMNLDYASRITPLRDNILVQLDDAKPTSEGGIALPDICQNRPLSATVVSVGPEAEIEVLAGDKILLALFGGVDLGDGFLMVKEIDVHGVLVDGVLHPLRRNVVVAMLPQKEQKGSIFLPEKARQTEEFGVVVLLSKECKLVSEGDYVYVGKTQGFHYRWRDCDHIILAETAIQLALVEE